MIRELNRYEIEMKIDARHISIYEPDPTKIQILYWPINEEDKAQEMELIRANKAAILEVLHERESIKKFEEESGYHKVLAARQAKMDYLRQVEAMADRGTSVAPKAPEVEPEEVEREYPRGVAYATLRIMADSENITKSDIGQAAILRLVNGEDPKNVVMEAKEEWRREAGRLVENN